MGQLLMEWLMKRLIQLGTCMLVSIIRRMIPRIEITYAGMAQKMNRRVIALAFT